jgi:tRNA-2-methylthio-N6-dimethylallyladenosine synthase
MSGRARDNRLVHFDPAGTSPRPGDVVTTVVTRGAPHYLIADGAPLAVRRTPGGDAWEARRDGAAAVVGDPGPRPGQPSARAGMDVADQAGTSPAGGPPMPGPPVPVLLGMPARHGPA